MFSKQSKEGTDPEEGYYGYGVWIIDNPTGKDFVYFQGCAPEVSFISEYNPDNDIISVLVSNYGDDVWGEMPFRIEEFIEMAIENKNYPIDGIMAEKMVKTM